jgi:hypothetical protein
MKTVIENLLDEYDMSNSAFAKDLRKALAEQPAQQEPTLQEQLDEALHSLGFYRRRIDALQKWQSKMRDPERTIVCDIIANGHTLEPAGDRYTAPPQRTWVGLTDEEKAVLRECREQAMKWTVQARIPECGAFGAIAQDLDWLCDKLAAHGIKE